jgi:hypothetical protein
VFVRRQQFLFLFSMRSVSYQRKVLDSQDFFIVSSSFIPSFLHSFPLLSYLLFLPSFFLSDFLSVTLSFFLSFSRVYESLQAFVAA